MAQFEELLDEIEDILEEGKGKAFSNKMVVDGEAMRTVIEDIRLSVPEEIKQAKILASERREIMNRANHEAEGIVNAARVKSRDLLAAAEKRVQETDADTARRTEVLVRDSQERAREIIETAKAQADEMIKQENILKEAQTASDNLIAQAQAAMDEAKKTAEDILEEAKKNAADLLEAADKKAKRIEEDADYLAQSKMDAATKWSHDLKLNASTYVDDLVNETEYRVAKSLNEIRALQDNLKKAAEGTKKPNKKNRI